MKFTQFRCLVVAILVAAGFGVPKAEAAPVPCRAGDLQIAETAQTDAQGTLQAAMNFIKGSDAKTKALLARWFGASDAATAASVSGVLGRSNQWLNSVNFYCLYQNDGSHVADMPTAAGIIRVDYSGELFAYVNPAELGKVNLGLAFFKAPASTGYDSKLGTLVHEMTHYWITGNTNSSFDDVYDEASCLDMAKNNPTKAKENAQNYEYFIEEWLAQ
jgi:hypothetical protein